MNAVRKLMLVAVIAVSCVGCDQATKSAAVSALPEDAPLSYMADTVRLQVVYNPGGFLSYGSSYPESSRRAVFLIGVGVLLLGLLVYILASTRMRPAEVSAFTLFLAGGFSNLIDRLTNDGHVVDFINVGVGSLRTGIFNVADAALILGVLILVAASLREQFHKAGCKEDREGRR